ncbi:MAG: hypothetical protein RMX68_011540 [Aulosira sp. ZfuVER01]|nr:hypothetical protein [Aulosira sp. ZfuVER01]MDZ8002877.1 hypothetical protein [Aulosira sp. DedVER01a]MDZ8056443.1 hypothetical protein [Aulosira sp. ZfuCHP01]
MSSDIYLIQDCAQLAELTPKALLQKLIAEYPNLLAVADEHIDGAINRNWLLVSQEETIANAEANGGYWALDHLFLDENGIPTLIKVKRGHDTPIRREIVSQMLDYAANAVNYWSLQKIRAQFEAKPNAQQLLIELLGEKDANPDRFWQQVTKNLQAVKIRLVFVATQIPAELQRIVEFLNQQMKPAQFFAVEIQQLCGSDNFRLGNSPI